MSAPLFGLLASLVVTVLVAMIMVAVSELLHPPDLVLAGLTFLLIVASAIVGIVLRVRWNASHRAPAPMSPDDDIR